MCSVASCHDFSRSLYARLLCEEKTSRSAPDTPLTEALEVYFAPSGVKSSMTFEELKDWASVAYRRYMTAAAYEDALGDVPRDPDVYYDPEPVYEPEEDAMDVSDDGHDGMPLIFQRSKH